MPIDYFRGQGGFGEGPYGGLHRHRVASAPQYFVSYPAAYGVGNYGAGGYGIGGPFESTGTTYGQGPYGAGGYGGGDNIGNLYGNVDGQNKVFTIRNVAKRMRVFLNGLAQTINYDVAVGPEVVVFLKTIPQPGDIILVQAWL